MALFNHAPDNAPLKQIKLFCNKWTLEDAIAKCLDITFQDNKNFQKLISELYAHAFVTQDDILFKFLENRFNANVIQDKEIHLHFDVVTSREEANK